MSELSLALLSFYKRSGRKLPWRTSNDPYQVWVSEIMLQQTRVETVKPYFLRFMKELPDVASLANADEATYLKLWEGLGYYSRVRNLHKAAEMVMNDFGGVMPQNKQDLLRLSGIGDYTANAIMAFAYNENAIAVDGNLIRVYARLNARKIVPNEPKSKEEAERFFLKHIDDGHAREINSALMDLGELVCLPNGTPKCEDCPLAPFCKAHQKGKETDYPLPKKKVEKRIQKRFVYLVVKEGKVYVQKRPSTGLLAKLHEFPNIIASSPEEGLIELNIPAKSISFALHSKHVFTHLVWEMDAYIVIPTRFEGGDGHFVDKDELLDHCTLPSAFSPFLDYLLDNRYI